MCCGLVASGGGAVSGESAAAGSSARERGLGEFEDTDVGIGVHFSWHPMVVVGAEAEVGIYPENFAGVPAFSGSRVEGLFGVTVGPGIGRLRPFAKLRPGFVTFHEAPEPLACIAIFPPPLPCALASGRTVFAIDWAGEPNGFRPSARSGPC